MANYCVKCSNELSGSENFCPNCGSKLGGKYSTYSTEDVKYFFDNIGPLMDSCEKIADDMHRAFADTSVSSEFKMQTLGSIEDKKAGRVNQQHNQTNIKPDNRLSHTNSLIFLIILIITLMFVLGFIIAGFVVS